MGTGLHWADYSVEASMFHGSLAGPLASPGWLAEVIDQQGVAVVDASWYLPASGREGHAEYLAGHIPGARWFDIDALSDASTSLPHMMPPAADFAAAMETLGIGDGDLVVCYDGSGTNLSAARAWWMFRAFGHDRVAVLDGGLGRWKAEGRPLESGPPAPVVPARFTATLQQGLIASWQDVTAGIADGSVQVADARSPGRFAGTEPEPRSGIRGGHIPGSLSLPYPDLVAPDGTLLPDEALRRRLGAAGVRLDRPTIALCGSGVTACAILLALEQLGCPGGRLYDGSWTEWGGRSDLPVETGPANPD